MEERGLVDRSPRLRRPPGRARPADRGRPGHPRRGPDHASEDLMNAILERLDDGQLDRLHAALQRLPPAPSAPRRPSTRITFAPATTTLSTSPSERARVPGDRKGALDPMMEGIVTSTDGTTPRPLRRTRPSGCPHRAKMEILFAVLLGHVPGRPRPDDRRARSCPRIVTELNGNDLYTWVVTIYLLTSTITVPIYGKLSDLYGRKPIFMIGIVLFLIGSALSGLSQDDVAADPVPRHPGPRRRRAVPDRPGGHRRPVHAGRARQVPGPVRGRVRDRLPRSGPASAAS